MKKSLLLFSLLLTTSLFAQNPEYQFDYNLLNRIARLWTNYEITLEYDAFDDHLMHTDYILKEGYVYKRENSILEKIGFYNDELLVAGQQAFELKRPALGRIAVRKKENKNWIRVKQSKNTLTFIEDATDLPEVVKIWVLRAALQREITFIEQQLYEKMHTNNTTANTI